MNMPDNLIEPVSSEKEEAKPKPKRKPRQKKVAAAISPAAPAPPKPVRPRKSTKKKPSVLPVVSIKHRVLWSSLEILGLSIAAVATIMVLLGYSAKLFSGTHFLTSLLPFAVGILALIIATTGFLMAWWKSRKWLKSKYLFLPALVSVSLAVTIGLISMQDQFALARGHFRTLLGGRQEAGRVTLSHQVYAAYRRYDQEQLQKILKRAEVYKATIKEAAEEFEIDPNILQGVAATESSFLPRDSADGGRGLFQITQVPKEVIARAGKKLAEHQLSLENPRHNAFLAAATLKYYLEQMHNDLFLGLLAYNIGPSNGGLRFIMQQYGANDFFTIQPYLQQLPRDYPIRVLSYALAFRLWQKDGALLAYEEGKNAQHIQSIGIPGLLMDF